MANKFDRRQDLKAQALFKKIPGLKHTPLVGAADLEEILKVFEAIPEWHFPIESAGQLIDKHGGPDQKLNIAGVEVDPLRMIKYMPAYYFPIVSMENFVEKMAELIRQNRKQVDVPKELENIKAQIREQIPEFKFPIPNAEALLKMVSRRQQFTFQGGHVDPKQIMQRIPSDYFPIESEEDFDKKIGQLMSTRPLIVKD